MASSGQRHRSIQTKFFLLLLVTLLPILFIQGYIYYDRFTAIREEEFQANTEVARAVAVAFDSFVRDIIHQELAIAIAATASPPLSPADLKHLLEQSSKDISDITFHWVGPDGRILASSRPDAVGSDLSDRPYFKEIASGREWFVSDLIISRRTEEPVITINRGIRSPGGDLLGLAVAVVDSERLRTVLAFERSKEAGASLVDRNGMHVARNPPTRYTLEQRNWLKFYPRIERALRGEEVAVTVTSKVTEKKRLVAFVPISAIGWVAAASRLEDEVTAAVISNLVTHGTLFLLVTLSAFGAAFVLSRSITTAVGRLHDLARALGRGETESLDAPAPSELVELADAFARMKEEVKDREDALRDSEKHMRAIIESAEEAIIILDDEQRCLEANPAAGVIAGDSHARLVGRSLREFIDPDYDLSTAWEGFLKTGRFRGEVRIRHRGGDERIVDASGKAHVSPGRHLLVGHDITERKRAEEELRRAHDELEERVRERTAELESRNLELQNFTFVAAHDLQEPLRKIQTFGDLVPRKFGDSISAEASDYIRRMRETAARMQQVLQSLLQYSKVTSMAEPFRRVDLNEIARGVVSDFELQIRASDASVEIENLPEIEADGGQMRQLFQNLLENALKFRGEERPRVRIHADCDANGASPSGEYRIYVEDNGIGFDEKYLDKVFAPFQRLHARGEYDGVGMGLAICRKIVERHKGAITAKSTPDRGSTFMITLPAEQGEK